MVDKSDRRSAEGVYRSNYRASLLSAAAWRQHFESLLSAASLLEIKVREVWRHNIEWMKAFQEAEARHTLPEGDLLSSDIFRVHFMLVGFAVENLLKAALVQIRHWDLGDSFDKSGKLPSVLNSHDICLLCSHVGIKLSLEEEELARRLTRASKWAGRYPLPVDFKASATAETFSDGKKWSISHFRDDDPDRLATFIARVRAETGF